MRLVVVVVAHAAAAMIRRHDEHGSIGPGRERSDCCVHFGRRLKVGSGHPPVGVARAIAIGQVEEEQPLFRLRQEPVRRRGRVPGARAPSEQPAHTGRGRERPRDGQRERPQLPGHDVHRDAAAGELAGHGPQGAEPREEGQPGLRQLMRLRRHAGGERGEGRDRRTGANRACLARQREGAAQGIERWHDARRDGVGAEPVGQDDD